MPIQKIRGGFRYGTTGKIYYGPKAREKARRQGSAIELSKLRREGRIEVKGSEHRRAHMRSL